MIEAVMFVLVYLMIGVTSSLILMYTLFREDKGEFTIDLVMAMVWLWPYILVASAFGIVKRWVS